MKITSKLPLNLKGGPTKRCVAAGTIECKYFYKRLYCAALAISLSEVMADNHLRFYVISMCKQFMKLILLFKILNYFFTGHPTFTGKHNEFQ